MTMTVTGKTTGPEAAAPAIKAAKALHAKYVAAGDEKAAKIVAEVSNLFHNITFAEAKADEPATVSASVDGSEVDISGMSTSDAAAYAEYVAELDGSARLARHIADLEEEDAEMTAIFGARDGS
jgi:CRISPR/Cas system-associated exonuclease Cas4 (RecB family)